MPALLSRTSCGSRKAQHHLAATSQYLSALPSNENVRNVPNNTKWQQIHGPDSESAQASISMARSFYLHKGIIRRMLTHSSVGRSPLFSLSLSCALSRSHVPGQFFICNERANAHVRRLVHSHFARCQQRAMEFISYLILWLDIIT